MSTTQHNETEPAGYEETIECILDELNKLGRVASDEEYVHVARAADAIRELATELNIEISFYTSI